MEECLFRAVPLALGALIGGHFGRRRLGIAIAFVLQAVVFGAAHANYPGFPPYSRLVELVVPSLLWAAIFLRFGLLPTILLHALFDLALFSIPLYLVDAPGAWAQRAAVIAAALVPLAIVLWRRAGAGAWGELPPVPAERRMDAGRAAAAPRGARAGRRRHPCRGSRAAVAARARRRGSARVDRLHAAARRRAAAAPGPGGGGGGGRRRVEGARRHARSRMAPDVHGAAGNRGRAVAAAQVRLAGGRRDAYVRSSARRSPRRCGKCATRCSKATSRHARRNGGSRSIRRASSPAPPRASRIAAGRTPLAGGGARARRSRAVRALRCRSRRAQARRRRRGRPAGAHRLVVHVRRSAGRRGQGWRGAPVRRRRRRRNRRRRPVRARAGAVAARAARARRPHADREDRRRPAVRARRHRRARRRREELDAGSCDTHALVLVLAITVARRRQASPSRGRCSRRR